MRHLERIGSAIAELIPALADLHVFVILLLMQKKRMSLTESSPTRC